MKKALEQPLSCSRESYVASLKNKKKGSLETYQSTTRWASSTTIALTFWLNAGVFSNFETFLLSTSTSGCVRIKPKWVPKSCKPKFKASWNKSITFLWSAIFAPNILKLCGCAVNGTPPFADSKYCRWLPSSLRKLPIGPTDGPTRCLPNSK